MDLQTFINTYNNKTVGTGQCGELVDAYLVDVFENHTEYDTAYEYWTNGIPGFVVMTTPEPGDIACYKPHTVNGVEYPDGHIAIYVGNGIVFEQNADPDGSPAHEFARATTYLLGYLRKGENMVETPTVNQGDIENMYQSLLNRPADDSALQTYNGMDWKTFVYALLDSAEFQIDHTINSGDVVNMKNKGVDVSGAEGQPWKTGMYAVSTTGVAPEATVLQPGTYKVN